MFENLSDKLHDVFRTLRGNSTLTESNISDALEEVRRADTRSAVWQIHSVILVFDSEKNFNSFKPFMAERVLCLPLYAGLSLEECDRICDVILG